jgi:hypothetical protein
MKDQISSTVYRQLFCRFKSTGEKAGDQRNADSTYRCALRLFHPGGSF